MSFSAITRPPTAKRPVVRSSPKGARAGIAHASVRAIDTLAAFHAQNSGLLGIGREKLRLALTPRLPKDAFIIYLANEVGVGRLVMEGAFVCLPGHTVVLSPSDEALFARILPSLLGTRHFRPPRVWDVATALGAEESEVRRVLKLAQRLARTDQVAQDHFFARSTIQEMVGLLHAVASEAEGGWIAVAAFRDRWTMVAKWQFRCLIFSTSTVSPCAAVIYVG